MPEYDSIEIYTTTRNDSMATTATRRRGQRTPTTVRSLAEAMALEGKSATEVHEFLLKQVKNGNIPANGVPDLRTIQRIVKDLPARRSVIEMVGSGGSN